MNCSDKEVEALFDTPQLSDLLVDVGDVARFLDVWERVVEEAVLVSDVLKDGEVFAKAYAFTVSGRLITRIFAVNEMDAEDD